MSPIMKYFQFAHLPRRIQDVSRPIWELATRMDQLPDCAEKSAGLRKLLEAKDCLERAALETQDAHVTVTQEASRYVPFKDKDVQCPDFH